MMAVWFFFGLLCGAAGVGMCLGRRRPTTAAVQTDRERGTIPKEWVETRNFLYYDGTEMPVVKEEE